MPDDKKHKGKSDAKEQRKPRHGRQQPPVNRKDKDKIEKKHEEPKEIKAPAKPVYEDPGPEFYKNLKRETDQILKITEEANSKYKKKEIQSNWSKYEMPIESYDEFEEQEHMGADYEKLIQTPLSIGGHFQFKHEKSWDISTAPSLYDKYFEMDMDSLATALCTIPFYERNNIDKSLFSDMDISNMENRSVRYKQKYYNDKTFTTPELEIQDKILSSVISKDSDNRKENDSQTSEALPDPDKDIDLEEIKIKSTSISSHESKSRKASVENTNVSKAANKDENIEQSINEKDVKFIDELDEILKVSGNKDLSAAPIEKLELQSDDTELPKLLAAVEPKESDTRISAMESPEDLEKWLDDFLDG